jgi:hypothetical protein
MYDDNLWYELHCEKTQSLDRAFLGLEIKSENKYVRVSSEYFTSSMLLSLTIAASQIKLHVFSWIT